METSFWKAVHYKKLDELKLSEEPQLLNGYMRCSKLYDDKPLLFLDGDAFVKQPFKETINSYYSVRVEGLAILVNIESGLEEAVKNVVSKAADYEKANVGIRVNFVIVAYINHKNFTITYTFLQLKRHASFGGALHEPGKPTKITVTPNLDLIRKTNGVFVGNAEAVPVLTDTTQKELMTTLTLEFAALNLGSETDPALQKDIASFYITRDPFSITADGKETHLTAMLITLDKTKLLAPELQAKPLIEKHQLGLKAFLSPEALIEELSNLNLKLMKWRLEPELDLEKLQSQRALILGSGTLGCNIARLLLGYGVRNLTFLDYSKVSYSNLARQSLFTSDCFNDRGEGLPKAVAAAQAVLKIAPHANVKSVEMRIPMPGHYAANNQIDSIFNDLKRLEELMTSHDVIFNVFDSREARYFPTAIGSLFNKNVISVGIGYESFIIVQHGFFGEAKTKEIFEQAEAKEKEAGATDFSWTKDASHIDRNNAEADFGCFFCSDYIVPVDTISNRSMDQQCTVSRPGVSMQSSAIAVEMYVNNIHKSKIGPESHFIRGSIGSSFDLTQFENRRFTGCIACSKDIVSKYLTHRREFLMHSLNESKNLYQYSGFVPPADDGDESGEVLFFDDIPETEAESMKTEDSQAQASKPI